MPDRKRVLIIGGGPAALATAFELTADGRDDEFDVTILQPGWRMGGKCASGRNRALNNRIEEHGLHVWFGCYDNAFDVMRRCYSELGTLKASERYAFRSVEDAFEGIDDIVLAQFRDEAWTFKNVVFPRNRIPPQNFLAFAIEALGWVGDQLVRLHRLHAPERGVEGLVEGLELGLEGLRLPRIEFLGHAMSRLHRLAARLLADVSTEGTEDFLAVVDAVARLIAHIFPPGTRTDGDVIFLADTADLLLAMLRGVWKDAVLDEGFDQLNDEDLAKWLGRHGADLSDDPVEWPALLRAVYDGCFAYVDGDRRDPQIAAGRALQGVVRCMFHYEGSVIFRMRAGMGDTVIAPLYEVLTRVRKNVKVLFFHAARELVPSDGGDRIEKVRIVQQVPVGPRFRPLFDVPYGPDGKVLRCWPSQPPRGMLPAGAKSQGGRLEHEIDPFRGSARTLVAGRDFDRVVLAVPPDVQGRICKRLIEASRDYATMLAASPTVVTQAMQLWLNRSVDELDQQFRSESILSCYVEPLDTYCDMAHLIEAEGWPRDTVRHIAYFCGVLPHAGLRSQAQADQEVVTGAQRYLERDVALPWPGAVRAPDEGDAGGEAPGDGASRGFMWDLLVPPVAARGRRGSADGRGAAAPAPSPEGLATQYTRANYAPTERYVLTVPGTVEERLEPGDSGFDNLVLAGDWTVSGFDAGCVEAAVTSGRLAASAICGKPPREDIAGLHGPASLPSSVGPR